MGSLESPHVSKKPRFPPGTTGEVCSNDIHQARFRLYSWDVVRCYFLLEVKIPLTARPESGQDDAREPRLCPPLRYTAPKQCRTEGKNRSGTDGS